MLAPILLNAIDSAEFIGVSERLFHELRHNADFPKAVVLSARCVRWNRQQLAAYVENLPAIGAQSEPPQLRRSRTPVRGK